MLRGFLLSIPVVLSLCSALAAASALPPLRLITSEKMPFNYLAGDEVSGLTVDLLRLMLPAEQIAAIELMPWPRAMDTALRSKNLLLFTMGNTRSRQQQGFHFVGPVSRRFHVLYAISDQLPPVRSLADIKQHQLVVAGLRAGWLSDQLKANGVRMEQVGDYQQGMQMLLKGRAQLWLSTDLEEPVLQARYPDAPKLKAVWQMFCTENFLGLSPGTAPEVAAALQHKFQQVVSSDAGRALAAKWQQQLGIALQLNPQYGFHLNNPQLTQCQPYLAP